MHNVEHTKTEIYRIVHELKKEEEEEKKKKKLEQGTTYKQ